MSLLILFLLFFVYLPMYSGMYKTFIEVHCTCSVCFKIHCTRAVLFSSGWKGNFLHRIHMELANSKVYFGSMCTAGCTCVVIGWDPATPPLPTHLGSHTRAPLVSQDRRNLFVTPFLFSLCSRTLVKSQGSATQDAVLGQFSMAFSL